MSFKLWGVGVVIALSLSNIQAAQVIADRPGFSTGTHTVAPNQFSLEVGYQADMNGSTTVQTVPISNLRTGLTDTLEFNIQWGGYRLIDGRSREADLALGLKQRVVDTADYNLSALVSLGLPTGETDAFNEVTAVAGLLWDRALKQPVSLFGVVQVQSNYIARSREFNLQVALGASFTHADKLGSYVELYSDMPLTYSGDSQSMINGGLTYLLDSTVQLDAYIGTSVEGDRNEFIGFGIAKLF